MRENSLLIIYGTRRNRYSINALCGALHGDPFFDDLPILLPQDPKTLLRLLEENNCRQDRVIVAFSFASIQAGAVRSTVDALRRRYEGLLLIAGGPHATGDPEDTLAMGFDIAVRGEGEATLRELLKQIDSGGDYDRVKGIAFPDDTGHVHFTGWRKPVNLDEYEPFPLRARRFGPIEITRGCPFACHFCQTSFMFPGRIRHRSIAKICENVESMKRVHLYDQRFISSNAFAYGSLDGRVPDLAKLEELLASVKSMVKPRGRVFFGTFPSEVRPEHITEEALQLVCRYADNDNITIGAQSGSQRVLDLCHRGHTTEDIYRAVRLTLEAGLMANVDFIFGLPGEREDDAKKTMGVMEDLVAMGARIHAHTFVPLPGTPFSSREPGGATEDTRRFLSHLRKIGSAYGEWRKKASHPSKP